MLRDKLKLLIPKEDGNDKKKIENLVVFIIILIITIIAINCIWKDDKKEKSKGIQDDISKKLADENCETTTTIGLEDKLESILHTIQGVGRVNVFINYSESSEVVAMFNENSKSSTTEETDTSGGKRIIEQKDTQKDIVYQENDGEKLPITQKTIH